MKCVEKHIGLPDSKSVTQLVKTEESFKIDWPKYDVEVKRFYSKISFCFFMDISLLYRLSHFNKIRIRTSF